MISAFEGVLAPYLNVEAHYYDVVIVVIGLVVYGKYLEMTAKQKTGKALETLLHLQAKTLFVERNGEVVEIGLDDVQAGEIVHVKP